MVHEDPVCIVTATDDASLLALRAFWLLQIALKVYMLAQIAMIERL